MAKILFLSNGHGEDIIGATIVKELLRQDPTHQISALPIVGEGKAYDPLGITILGPRKVLPSGGFIYHNLSNLFKDLFSGLIGGTLKQINLLRKLRGEFDLVVSIGDIVPILSAWLTKTPFVFIGCAKSDYYEYSYNLLEKWFLKKYCVCAFPRDLKTTQNLQKVGIKAEYVGNPMMDAMEITGEDFGIDPHSAVVGFLPGSHQDAYINLEDLCKVAKEIANLAPKDKKVNFLVALAPNLQKEVAAKLISGSGIEVKIIQGKFGDVLNRSNIVIGLSGTGNEQAIGLGKPVVSFGGRGIQHTKKFAKDKKQLLGDSIALIDSDPSLVAQEVWSILQDPSRVERMRRVGEERMGGPGATKKIVEIINRL